MIIICRIVQIIKYYNNPTDLESKKRKEMHSELDKQNVIKNSKLEMSIKPFSLVRQDLGKSKSQQKNRKGISRVNSSNKNQSQTYSQGPVSIPNSTGPILIPTVISYSTHVNAHNSKPTISSSNWESSRLKNGQTNKKEGEEYKLFERNAKNECLSTFPNNFPAIEQQSRKREMDLIYRIEQLQKQLIVVERQNGNCLAQKREWIKKCQQLCEANQNLFNKVSELTEELKFRNKCQEEKQEVVKKKQKYIEELLQQNKIQRDTVKESYRKINQLNSQLQILTTKVVQFQNKEVSLLQTQSYTCFNQGINFRINATQHIQSARQQLEIQKQQLFNLREQNRQFLIKNSSLTEQKNKWQSKLNIVMYEFENEKQKYQVMKQKYEELGNQMEYLQKQAMFGRAYKKQAEEGEKIREQLEYIKHLNLEYEIKIKELQQRRLNQIEFHQEQIKRVQHTEATKYENIIEIYKNEKNEALQQMDSIATSCNYNHNQTIQNLSKQYENLVVQLKHQLQEQLHKVHQLETKCADKQKQIAELKTALTSLKDNNSLLINRFNEQKNSNSMHLLNFTDRQRELQKEIQKLKQNQKKYQIQREINKIRDKQRQSSSTNQIFQSFQGQLKNLQNRNVEMSIKLGEYEFQATKLSDKIHILQIQAQKSRNRQDSYERKIKHLSQELQHLQINKNKSIDEKIKIVEELQSLRMEQKSKQGQEKMKLMKLQEYQHKLKAFQKKQTQSKEIINQMVEKNKLMSVQIHNLNNQVIKAQKEFQSQNQSSLCIAASQYKQLEGQMLEKEKEIQKYKECIQILKQQVAIGKEKARITEQISEKICRSESYTERNRENRILNYKNIIMNLNPEQHNITIDGNTWKLSEQEIISIVNKAARISGEYRNQLEVRLNKIQIQHKELIEAEGTTRALAQKYHEKTLQLQNLLIKMEEAHNKKIFLVKQDYDAVYNKYLKYRNMVIAQNKERDRERERERDLSKDKFFKK